MKKDTYIPNDYVGEVPLPEGECSCKTPTTWKECHGSYCLFTPSYCHNCGLLLPKDLPIHNFKEEKPIVIETVGDALKVIRDIKKHIPEDPNRADYLVVPLPEEKPIAEWEREFDEIGGYATGEHDDRIKDFIRSLLKSERELVLREFDKGVRLLEVGKPNSKEQETFYEIKQSVLEECRTEVLSLLEKLSKK